MIEIEYTHEGQTLRYEIDETTKTAKVVQSRDSKISGGVVIPKEVTYNNTTYSVTSIGESAFCRCSSLTSITIPNSVTSIGKSAFSGCSSLTSITIPNSVISIGDYAFVDCSSLTSITIPNSVTSIGHHAFSYCSSLTSIVVESGNTIYDSRNNCNAIIETSTNALAVGCENTIIPDSVTKIWPGAFWGRSSLTSITIPNSVTEICDSAFSDCNSLTSITIPNSVKEIGNFAFENCTKLESITIGTKVKEISSSAFKNCESLRTIYSMKSKPPAIEGCFTEIPPREVKLFVPKGKVDNYKCAEGWEEFPNIKEFDFDAKN